MYKGVSKFAQKVAADSGPTGTQRAGGYARDYAVEAYIYKGTNQGLTRLYRMRTEHPTKANAHVKFQRYTNSPADYRYIVVYHTKTLEVAYEAGDSKYEDLWLDTQEGCVSEVV